MLIALVLVVLMTGVEGSLVIPQKCFVDEITVALFQLKSCAFIFDAADHGIRTLNSRISADLQLVRVCNASVNQYPPALKTLIYNVNVQVAPFLSCPDTRNFTLLEKIQRKCKFNQNSMAVYNLLISHGKDGSWSLMDATLLDSHGVQFSPVDVPMPGSPRQAIAQSSSDKISYVMILSIFGGIFMAMFATHSIIRHHRTRGGYSRIIRKTDSSSSQPSSQLFGANPVPINEEKKLTHSHEHNERFAV